MPQLDPSSYASQIFWLVVLFGLLYFLMVRFVLPRIADVMEERQDKVDDDLARAERLRAEKDEVLAEYEASIGAARDEAAAHLKQSGEASAAELAKQQESFTQELAQKAVDAEVRISAAKSEAMANVKSVATDAALAITAKLIGVSPAQGVVQKAVDDALGGRG